MVMSALDEPVLLDTDGVFVYRVGEDGLITSMRAFWETERAMASLAKQFANHTIERAYNAVVWGTPRDGSGAIDTAAITKSNIDIVTDAVVTLKTQFTAPPTCGSEPAKSNAISLPALRTVSSMRTGVPVTPSVSM